MTLSPRLALDAAPALILDTAQRAVRDRVRRRLLAGEYELEEVPCWCGAEDGPVLAQIDRWGLPLTTRLCARCGLLRTSPRFTPAGAERFYRSDFQDLFAPAECAAPGAREAGAFKQQLARGERLVACLGPLLGAVSTVYEVGCGTGGNLVPFARAGKRVAGCDLGGDFLGPGQALGLDLVRGGAGALLEHRGEPADLVLLLHVLEHFGDLDRELAEVLELVRPGGLLLVLVPGVRAIEEGYGGDLLRFLQLPHNHTFTRRTLSMVLVAAGLQVLTADEQAVAIARRPPSGLTRRAPAPEPAEALSVLRHLAGLERRLLRGRSLLAGTATPAPAL